MRQSLQLDGENYRLRTRVSELQEPDLMQRMMEQVSDQREELQVGLWETTSLARRCARQD